MRVPLSRRTFFPVEVITLPCVAFEAAAFKFKPFKPKTPWLFEVSCPAASSPPTAPREAPATFPPALAAEFNVPLAAPPAFAAVFVTVPTAPPAARSEEHTSELQSRRDLVCRLLLEKKKK